MDADSNLFWFSMDYVSARKATDHLAIIGREELVHLRDLLLNYFNTSLRESEWRPPPVADILLKIEQLKVELWRRETNQSIRKSLIDFLSLKIPEAYFPAGFCHGDLTMSNILFHPNGIFLIDFLDSFMESPVIDMVKIRQDTRYYWTLLIDSPLSVYETNKVKLSLNYLDKAVRDYIEKDDRLLVWHDYLEIMNLARILPYVTRKQEIDFLTLHLSDLLNNTKK